MTTGILSALEVQGRVIKALFLREMKTRFGESRMGVFWAFIEPMVHVLILVLVWAAFGHMGPPGIDPVLFLYTGVIPLIMFSNIMNKTKISHTCFKNS